MRLLYVVPDPDRIGGISRSIARVTTELRRAGHDVHVFCPDPWAGRGIQATLEEEVRGALTGTTKQIWTDRTLAEIERLGPELVVGYHGSQGAFAAVAAALLAELPVVVSLRGNDVDLDFFSSLHHAHLAFAVTHADAVTAVSNEMRRKLALWLDVDAVFIANSVDREAFFADPRGAERLRREWEIGEGPVVGLFGELKPKRGLALLAELEDVLAPATTLLVGEVRDSSRHEVPPWVRSLPYVTELEDLRAAYTLCDVVLQPSLHDGMPNVVLEAMACERVVVASTAGGLPDLLRDGENGFLCREPEEWRQRLRRLLAAPRPEIGAAARRSVPSPDEESRAFDDLFERVLAARHRKRA